MKSPILSLIVAAAENNAIGKNNDLIWHLPTDMKFFKDTTTGHCVIMGRKNYDSIPLKYRPLSNRTNIIVTRQKDFTAPGCIVAHSLGEAIARAKEIEEVELFIIGGAEIYAQSISLVDKIYLTRVHHSFEADAFFPEVDFKHYKIRSSLFVQQDTKNPYSFTITIYEKK
ncbi:MAG TPA: dihydrofolate reductase [Bacteroidia bacterium]|nr:dihydrofolate reductase [Bacteroidia bacterium]HRH09286.1 dihydrofolate reductase [Bacteroidia bacterium]HRH62704.1 dihydrofolate reductase [Bacteroidia bacterium]